MIPLDTNYLIRVLVEGTLEAAQVSEWIGEGAEFCTAAIAWYEFLSGPVDAEGIDIVHGPIARDTVTSMSGRRA